MNSLIYLFYLKKKVHYSHSLRWAGSHIVSGNGGGCAKCFVASITSQKLTSSERSKSANWCLYLTFSILQQNTSWTHPGIIIGSFNSEGLVSAIIIIFVSVLPAFWLSGNPERQTNQAEYVLIMDGQILWSCSRLSVLNWFSSTFLVKLKNLIHLHLKRPHPLNYIFCIGLHSNQLLKFFP